MRGFSRGGCAARVTVERSFPLSVRNPPLVPHTGPAASARPHRLVAVLAGVLSAALLGGLLAVAPAPSDPDAKASTISRFDAGNIITDADMFNYTTMTTSSIQSFLDSKVPGCAADATAPCLKDYRTDLRAIPAVVNRCVGDVAPRGNATAAEIIFAISRACEINPQVLLVTLQKEQALVTDTSPTAGKYKIAMGYGCPDTAPCDSEYFGFVNQVYQAAYAFNKYTKSPEQYTAYQPGVRQIKYNPKASCGTATVNIENKATAALYFYTPYVPNAAAIAGSAGQVGDECSSYGNRNFWRYFYSWFGSENTDPYFVKNADTKQIYLIVDGKRRPVESKKTMRLISRYTGIPYTLPSLNGQIVSDIGRGSVEVLVPGSVVKSSKKSTSLWFIDGLGVKRPISTSQAIELTGSASADVVSKKTIAGYRTGPGAAKLGLTVDGRYYIADNGVLRRIRDTDLVHYKKRFGFGSYDPSTLKALRTGVSMGRLIKNDGTYYLVREGRKIKVSTAKYKSLVAELGKKAQPVTDYFADRIPTRK
jgi:hypothetical protein